MVDEGLFSRSNKNRDATSSWLDWIKSRSVGGEEGWGFSSDEIEEHLSPDGSITSSLTCPAAKPNVISRWKCR